MLELAPQVTGKTYLNRRTDENYRPDNPTLVLGGEEHEIEKLNETSKYYIDQVQDLNAQMTQIKAKLHQCEVARAGFVSLLASEIEAQNKVFKDGEDEEGTGDEVSGD